MYNIHSHYENVLAYLNTIVTQPTLIYLHPFGSTQPENIEALQNEGFGPLIIAYDQEPLDYEYNQSLFNYIRRNFKDDHGKPRPTILLTTEKRSDQKNKILNEFNYIDSNYFFHAFAAADWYRSYQYCEAITSPRKRQIKKKYIAFNRITGNSRVYRSFFVAELSKQNLLNNGHVSYSDVCPVHGSYSENLNYAIKKYNVSEEYAVEAKSSLDTIKSSLRIDKEGSIPNGSQTLGPITELMESFLHVVTETCFWDNRTHLTEKIFKPIVAKQPFLLLGCTKNLSYLKSYGFKTFDSWWDESYDQIDNPINRIQAVVSIIKDICNTPNDELERMLQGMNYVLDHNYNLFYSKDFIDNVWNEMTANLQSAIARL
jgi:hypothetical protein